MFGFVRSLFGGTAAVDPREADKTKLVKALSRDKYKWRTLDRLATIIGHERGYTRELLNEIGARASYRDDELYGLKSRVGDTGRRRY